MTAPGRSWTGMRTSTSSSGRGAPALMARRAVAARSQHVEQGSVVPLGHPPPHRPEGVDEQVEGGPRWPGRCRRRCPARWSAARRRCGSCRGTRRRPAAAAHRAPRPARRRGPSGWPPSGGARGTPRPPACRAPRGRGRSRSPPGRRARRVPGRRRWGRWWGSGVSTQVAPTNSSAEAPSTPTCSLPAMGWPPTNRGRSTAATSGPLTLPTSVTTASGFHSGDDRMPATTSAAPWTGVATTTRSAVGPPPRRRARRVRRHGRRCPVWRRCR